MQINEKKEELKKKREREGKGRNEMNRNKQIMYNMKVELL